MANNLGRLNCWIRKSSLVLEPNRLKMGLTMGPSMTKKRVPDDSYVFESLVFVYIFHQGIISLPEATSPGSNCCGLRVHKFGRLSFNLGWCQSRPHCASFAISSGNTTSNSVATHERTFERKFFLWRPQHIGYHSNGWPLNGRVVKFRL